MINGTVVYFAISLASMLFSSGIAASARQCSSFCVCDTWYDLERASCVGRHLYNIHTGAPDNVQALDLSDNVISVLTSFELAVRSVIYKITFIFIPWSSLPASLARDKINLTFNAFSCYMVEGGGIRLPPLFPCYTRPF